MGRFLSVLFAGAIFLVSCSGAHKIANADDNPYPTTQAEWDALPNRGPFPTAPIPVGATGTGVDVASAQADCDAQLNSWYFPVSKTQGKICRDACSEYQMGLSALAKTFSDDTCHVCSPLPDSSYSCGGGTLIFTSCKCVRIVSQ